MIPSLLQWISDPLKQWRDFIYLFYGSWTWSFVHKYLGFDATFNIFKRTKVRGCFMAHVIPSYFYLQRSNKRRYWHLHELSWTIVLLERLWQLCLPMKLVLVYGIKSEVFLAIASTYIQPNSSELIGQHSLAQTDNDLKHAANAELFEVGKKVECSAIS